MVPDDSLPEPLPTRPHRPRPVRPIETREVPGWTLKAYSVTESGGPVSPDVADAALARVPSVLRRHGDGHRFGFVVIHQASAFNTVIVDWWARGNELRHRVLRAPPETPTVFEDITDSGEAVCVWELAVQAHEREAWLRHMATGSPDPAAWERDLLDGRV